MLWYVPFLCSKCHRDGGWILLTSVFYWLDKSSPVFKKLQVSRYRLPTDFYYNRQIHMVSDIETSVTVGSTIISKLAQRPGQCFCIISTRQQASNVVEQDHHLMKGDFFLHNIKLTANNSGRLLGGLPLHSTTAVDIFVFIIILP